MELPFLRGQAGDALPWLVEVKTDQSQVSLQLHLLRMLKHLFSIYIVSLIRGSSRPSEWSSGAMRRSCTSQSR